MVCRYKLFFPLQPPVGNYQTIHRNPDQAKTLPCMCRLFGLQTEGSIEHRYTITDVLKFPVPNFALPYQIKDVL